MSVSTLFLYLYSYTKLCIYFKYLLYVFIRIQIVAFEKHLINICIFHVDQFFEVLINKTFPSVACSVYINVDYM